MEYGISFSLNYSDLHFTPLENAPGVSTEDFYMPVFNPGVGVRAGYKLSEDMKLSINPGINWLGAKSESETEGLGKSEGVYINIPLLIHYEFAKNISFNAGMSYDYLLNLSWTSGDQTFDGTASAENRSLFAAQTGISYAIGNMVELGLSYNHGLTPLSNFVFTDLNGNRIGESAMTNRYYQFKVTLRQ